MIENFDQVLCLVIVGGLFAVWIIKAIKGTD